MCRVVGAAGPHLLAAHQPATIDPRGLGGDGRCIRAGVGLAEQLTPVVLAAQRGPDPALELLRCAALHDGEQHPRTDTQLELFEIAQLFVDHELFDDAGATAERLGPVRQQVTRLDTSGLAFGDRQREVRVVECLGLSAVLLGLGRQVETQVRVHATGEQRCHVERRLTIAAEERREYRRTPQVQVCVVLPRVADATEDLDVLLRAAAIRGQRLRGSEGSGEHRLWAGGTRTRGVPRVGCPEFGINEHVRQVMLHCLERADRATELLAHLGVVGGRRHTCTGATDCLCCGQQTADGGGHHGATDDDFAVGDDETLDIDTRDTAGGIELLSGHAPHGSGVDEDDVVTHRQQQQIGQLAGEHSTGLARQSTVCAPCQRAGRGDRTDHRAIGQTTHVQFTLRRCADSSDDR